MEFSKIEHTKFAPQPGFFIKILRDIPWQLLKNPVSLVYDLGKLVENLLLLVLENSTGFFNLLTSLKLNILHDFK